MAGPPGGLLALVLLLAVFGAHSEDGLPKWSQRSSRSTGGWIPIEAPCLTCRAAAEAAVDMEVQASSDFASAPLKAPPAIVFKDTEFLRPPPAPVRVQRQEASRPILDTYIENQRPPPPPITQSTAGKQGRDHRFLYSHNPPRQQFQGFPLENQPQHIQHPRVVFPTHQTTGQTQDVSPSIQPTRQSTPFINQQFQHQAQSLQHQSLQHQALQQQSLHQQPLRPPKQIRLQGIPHEQFPLILPPSGLGHPHGFQSPQLQLLPVPHTPQPTTAQVNLQNIFQNQLQNQLHHQINQQLLGSPLASSFPPSAIGQQLDFPTRNIPIAPVNVQLVPQQQQVLQPVKSSPPPAQKLETTSSPKPSVAPLTTIQGDAPRGPTQKEKQVVSFQANPEDDVEEEVQLLYVPVEALRQRDRVNKQVLHNPNSASVRQKQTDRQRPHSFEIKHFQTPEATQFSSQSLGVIQGSAGTQVSNSDGVRSESNNAKANQGQETVVREEKLLTFTPPRVQQFHDNVAFQQQTQTLYPSRQFAQQNQDKFRFQPINQPQQEEQQSAGQQQSHKPHRPINQQFHRQPSVTQEENSQRFYQDAKESSYTLPPQTTSRPIATSPIPTYTTTQSSPSTSPAPYQPPLSVYMEDNDGQDPSKLSVDDVLRSLNGAKTVPVLERAGPNPPKVFVGPSVLRPPNGYAKFELPYLSMLDSNRVERKVDRLPFFVAPLSFQPPSGYAKIPFPAPHIGSVVVSSTPIASTTERILPIKQSAQSSPSSGLSELVNSLQSSVSPPGVEYTQTVGSVVPFSSTQQPLPLYNQNQQTYQQFTPQQPIYQQEYQQQPQRVENENPNQAALHQQLINHQNTQESAPKQQPLPLSQPHTFTYQSTPIPSQAPIYYSIPNTTPTTTTTTTTALPQTRAPAHHSRGRTRQRPSYSQTASSESDNNFRNRGTFRGNSASDTTRQPSTRTRRPWDGRRRPSTTTPEPNEPQDTYSFNSANQNYSPVQPLNDITPSTTSTTDSTRDAYLSQNIRETSSSLTQHQFSNDEIYSPVGQPPVNSNEGHLRNQGAVVLSAFQQPQVLGDVITGQIQKPDENTGVRTYYGGQREYTVSSFDPSPNLSVSPTLPQVQSPSPVPDQQSQTYKGTFDGESKNKDQSRQSLKSKDSERVTSFGGQKSGAFSNYQQPRGQKYFSQQNLREIETPVAPAQQSYSEGIVSATQGPYVEAQFVIPSGQRAQAVDSGRFRNYHQRPSSLKNQNQGQQSIYSTQFTPSVEISDTPNLQHSTPLPDISGVHGNQQPQYFIISTPIPNPVHGINRNYSSGQIFEGQQPLLYAQVNQSPHVKENDPVAVLVNEGLLSNQQGQQDTLSTSYKRPDHSPVQFVNENPTQLPKTTQATTTTQDPAYTVQTQEEPKRTRYRLPQRTYSGSGSQNAPEGSDVVNEERPRYRGHQSRYNGETRTRQPVQRTRGRHYTTESPVEEEAPAPPQRTQSLHQRYRGRQRTTAASTTSGNSQSSENLRSPVAHSSAVTERTLSGSQSELGGETPEFGSNTQDVSQLGQTDDQIRKTERHRSSQSQISQENSQDAERPVHSRGRTRLRGGDRAASRQRNQYGSFNNQESPSPVNTYSRNPTVGQRYQPRRNPGQDLTYQEPQRDHSPGEENPDDSQHVALAFDSSSQKTPLTLKTDDENSYSPNPIVIESYEAKDNKENVRIIQGAGHFLPPEASVNQAVVNEQYEQSLLSIDAGNEYQEEHTTPVPPSTTEPTTTTTTAAKPGRKYGNFVSRVGSPRRQSHVTAPINSVPPTTPPPDTNQPNKVYTVRPARRPVAKPTASTRIRIRRPTTPTPTTSTTTTEPSYYLTTSPPINTQQENPSYDTSSFGSTRGGFRVRKRPLAGSRRPASPGSNEVNQDEQEEEPARLQGGYRQRARVPSRRLLPSSTERTAARWRQSDFAGTEEQQEPATISQSAQGFQNEKTTSNADSYVESQNNDDPTNFRISLSEEQLASHIPTKALRTQEKVEAFNQSPVYQSGEQYYSQESQQPQGGQEVPLKYHNPPVRPSAFVVPEDTVYTYERSRPFSAQPVAQTYENSPDVPQQKGSYRQNQQEFEINFAGASRGEDSLYPNRDELESGQESRYFEKVKPSKANEESYSEQEKVKDEALQETSAVADIQPVRESPDDSQGHSTTFEAKAVTPQPEESPDTENKESVVNEEPSERNGNRLIKKVTGGRRRGNWVRVRTKTHRPRPGDSLETAESQNLASVSQNLLQFTTPLKEKTAPTWLNTPVPVEDKRPDSEPTSDDAEAEVSLEVTEPSVDSYSDLDLSDADEEQKEDASKNDPGEDIFDDLENGEFTPTERDTLDDEYDTKETVPVVPKEIEEVLSESIDPDTEESSKNASQTSEGEKSEETAVETGDSLSAEDKLADGETSTEQPEDDYDQQQEALLVKTEESTEETGESTTDQPTPRVLGTSTTTEISLETEICYRGRCVKTKVDADQVPIE